MVPTCPDALPAPRPRSLRAPRSRVAATEVPQVCEWEYGRKGDSAHHVTALYRTRRGAFFLAGKGGPRSMWAGRLAGGLCGPGSGIRVIDAEEARTHIEAAGCGEEVFAVLGLELEEG